MNDRQLSRKPFLSICITSYNRVNELYRCLKSVDTVNKDLIEIIVSEDCSPKKDEIAQIVNRFVSERDWEQFHSPKNLSMSIAIEAAELMEHFQWVKSDELPALLEDAERRAEITDELADITCYLLSLANALDIDVSSAVTAKMAKNARKYPADQFRGRYYKPGRTGAPPPLEVGD